MSAKIIKQVVYDENSGRRVEDAVLQCHCGEYVELTSGWANECDACGSEYNGSGQELAPREQWGYETGETFN